jgi:Tfp pilus assembly protein PilP
MTRWLSYAGLACALTSASVAPGEAQAPAPSQSKPAATAPAAEDFTYNPDGRRDPFVNLLTRGSEPGPASRRGDGLGNLAVEDLSLRGIVASRGGFVAVVQGPDSKTFIVHANDRLLNGSVKAITAQDMIVVQDVDDPLSIVKQREVRKSLRTVDETK